MLEEVGNVSLPIKQHGLGNLRHSSLELDQSVQGMLSIVMLIAMFSQDLLQVLAYIKCMNDQVCDINSTG